MPNASIQDESNHGKVEIQQHGTLSWVRMSPGEAPRRQGSYVHIVPLGPAYKAGLAGHFPFNRCCLKNILLITIQIRRKKRMLVTKPHRMIEDIKGAQPLETAELHSRATSHLPIPPVGRRIPKHPKTRRSRHPRAQAVCIHFFFTTPMWHFCVVGLPLPSSEKMVQSMLAPMPPESRMVILLPSS